MNYSELLSKSPIRNIINITEAQTIFELDQADKEIDEYGIRGLADNIEKTLKHMEEENQNKLKVVIVGELKAGKSTLVNALVGKEVAYTDVTEATAVVSEISNGNKDRITLYKKDGMTQEVSSFESMLMQMEERAQDQVYWSNIHKIKIDVKSNLLEHIVLVDTPGLLTITQENESITKEYIHKSDYILWIINGNNLGDSSVSEEIDMVMSYGKPVIGVINKIDSLEQKQEIEDYVEDMYDGIFKELFIVSARKAYRSRNKVDQEGWIDSGLSELEEYLCYLGKEGDKSKDVSKKDSTIYQLKREIDFHKKIVTNLTVRKQQYDSDMQILMQLHNNLCEDIKKELSYWLKYDLFKQERKELLECDSQEFNKKIIEYSNQNYINELIVEEYTKLSERIYAENNIANTKLFYSYGEKKFNSSVTDLEIDQVENRRKSSLNEAVLMKVGAKIGLGVAGYSAWLGPAASTVTIGSALIAWVPALSLAGVFAAKMYQNNVNQAVQSFSIIKAKKVEHLYNEVLSYVRKNELPVLSRSLKEIIDYCFQYQNEKINNIISQLNFSYEDESYNSFINGVTEYVDMIESIISGIEKENEISFVEKAYFE